MKKQLSTLHQLDPVGLVLFAAGLALILVPITISQTATNTWKSPHIIAMLVVGGVCAISFVIYELKWAKYPMLAPALLQNYTVNVALIGKFFELKYPSTQTDQNSQNLRLYS